MNESANPVHPAVHLLLAGDAATISRCLAMYQDGDDIVAMDSGVLALAEPESMALLAGRAVFSAVDIGIRGLKAIASEQQATCMGDEDLLELILSREHSLSWK